MFTSNEQEDAIHLDQGYDDRRYTVLEVPAIHQATPYNNELKEYWLPFIKWLEVEDNISRLHRYLLDHEYDRSLIRLPLQSEAKERMQQRSWDVIDGWLATMLSRGHPDLVKLFGTTQLSNVFHIDQLFLKIIRTDVAES